MPELKKKLIEVLACPKCRGYLIKDKTGKKLVCKKCRLAYKIESGIPILLLEKAELME